MPDSDRSPFGYHIEPGPVGAPWVVLCHGFGANASDLVGMRAALDPARELNWLYPEAPVLLGTGPAGPSRAWFPRKEAELVRVMSGEYFDRLADDSPPGLEQSATEVLSLLSSLEIDPGSALLGGFSQGSMVALRAALDADHPPRGMLLFSSGLVAAQETRAKAVACDAIPFVQSHGTNDPILPYDGACTLYDLLCGAGHSGRLISFPGGHAIPEKAVDAARRLVQTVLTG